LAEIWRMFRLSFKLLWTDPNEIPNMSATWWIASIVFEKFLHLIHTFICFACQWTHHYWIWKATKELCSSYCLPSKSYFQQLATFCSIFPSLMWNLMQTLNSHACYSLIPSRKWLSTVYLHLVVKTVLEAVLSFCGQPRKYFTPCTCIFANKKLSYNYFKGKL
jgi:hypothetical protein